MRWLIAATALALSATAAAACINDREVDSREREFKSQYLAPKATEQPPSPDSSNMPLAAAGGGLILITAAAVIAGRSA
jgi:hypothetical protein